MAFAYVEGDAFEALFIRLRERYDCIYRYASHVEVENLLEIDFKEESSLTEDSKAQQFIEKIQSEEVNYLKSLLLYCTWIPLPVIEPEPVKTPETPK